MLTPPAPHRSRRARATGPRLFALVGVFLLSGLVAACGSSSKTAAPSGSSGSVAAGNAAVTIKSFAFKPESITVKTGSTITWTNLDGTTHNIQFMSSSIPKSPDLSASGGQKSWSHTFAQAGTFPYICGIHNYMTGTVKVVP